LKSRKFEKSHIEIAPNEVRQPEILTWLKSTKLVKFKIRKFLSILSLWGIPYFFLNISSQILLDIFCNFLNTSVELFRAIMYLHCDGYMSCRAGMRFFRFLSDQIFCFGFQIFSLSGCVQKQRRFLQFNFLCPFWAVLDIFYHWSILDLV
jgi:hypothetical protein